MINLLFTSINAILIYYRFLVSPIVKRGNGCKYYRWYLQLKQKRHTVVIFLLLHTSLPVEVGPHTEIVHRIECDLFSQYNSSY